MPYLFRIKDFIKHFPQEKLSFSLSPSVRLCSPVPALGASCGRNLHCLFTWA